jgi:hypothetical protein
LELCCRIPVGLGAGGQGSVGFNESEPGRGLDESSIIVWILPPDSTIFVENLPRIQVITDDGRVFVDREAMSGYLGSWSVRQPIPNTPLRDEIVAAFKAGQLTAEFSRTQPEPKFTRVRPTVRFAGTTPVLRCV